MVELSEVKEATYLTLTERKATDETAAPASQPAVDGRASLKVETHHAGEALIQIIRLFGELGVEILSIETLEPNLETVFLHLTGKSLRE